MDARRDRQRKLVLIVDDDPDIRFLLSDILSDAGYDTVEADNGASGVALFAAHAPDLVVTDVIMPRKEGIETIEEIRRLNPKARIIAISGGGRIRDLQFLDLAKRYGADVAIPKPFEPETILAAARKLLEG